jgi:DNA-binding CsgD family transcriptional regulator
MAVTKKPEQLTPRQIEVISLMRRGLTNSEIAGELGISDDGVKAHLARLYLRFGVTNRVALLAAVDDALPRAHTGSTLGELRAIVGRSHDRSVRMGDETLPTPAANQLIVARDALTAVDVALELLRDLPPETAGPVLDALRKRVASAVAALNDVHPTERPAI